MWVNKTLGRGPYIIGAASNQLRGTYCFNVLYAWSSWCIHASYRSPESQPCRVGIMLECSTVEVLIRATVMHYDDKGHVALKHYAAFKGLAKWVRSCSGAAHWGRAGGELVVIDLITLLGSSSSTLASLRSIRARCSLTSPAYNYMY